MIVDLLNARSNDRRSGAPAEAASSFDWMPALKTTNSSPPTQQGPAAGAGSTDAPSTAQNSLSPLGWPGVSLTCELINEEQGRPGWSGRKGCASGCSSRKPLTRLGVREFVHPRHMADLGLGVALGNVLTRTTGCLRFHRLECHARAFSSEHRDRGVTISLTTGLNHDRLCACGRDGPGS